MNNFDRDYFENGLITGKSIYENYRWIPELTIPLAMTMIDYMGIKRGETVLDFGCAKGYLVKALRWLGRQAYGFDISEYAIANADPEIAKYVSTVMPRLTFTFCIAKDVFEHIEEGSIENVLRNINAGLLFAMIPLGEKGIYRAPTDNLDKTHKICADEHAWNNIFKQSGWRALEFAFKVPGIKDKYWNYPDAHGFFFMRKAG